MTKSHQLHRKKAIHMMFRRSPRIRRLFWKVTAIFDKLRMGKAVELDDH